MTIHQLMSNYKQVRNKKKIKMQSSNVSRLWGGLIPSKIKMERKYVFICFCLLFLDIVIVSLLEKLGTSFELKNVHELLNVNCNTKILYYHSWTLWCNKRLHVRVPIKGVDFVPYRLVRSVYTVLASKPVHITPLFRIGKNTSRIGQFRAILAGIDFFFFFFTVL